MTLKDLKQEALKLGIPIIEDEGLAYLLKLIEQKHIKNILEIGTAIGYSALQMAAFDVEIDTIERDEHMIKHAKRFIANHKNGHRIRLIEADALTYKGPLGSYDLIFIDAAKSQYKRFFEHYSTFLNEDGIIVCDNLFFHHLDKNKVKNRHTRALLKRLEDFRIFLAQNDTWTTEFIAVGDGLSVSKRVKNENISND